MFRLANRLRGQACARRFPAGWQQTYQSDRSSKRPIVLKSIAFVSGFSFGGEPNPILLTAQQTQLPQQIATGIVVDDSERATAAGQIEFVFRHICNYKVGSTAVVIEAVADVGELLKRERAIVLKPKFNVLVAENGAPSRLIVFLTGCHVVLSSKSRMSAVIAVLVL